MYEPDQSPLPQPFSAFGRILFLLLAMVVGMLIGQLIGLGVAQAAGLGDAMLSNPGWTPDTASERNLYRTVAMIGHICTFLLPGLAFAWFLNRGTWASAIQINRRVGIWFLLAGALWIILSAPVVQYLYSLNQSIPLPDWARQLEGSANSLIQSLLIMDTPLEFLFTLLVMAVLPAVGEELIFRGLIQRTLQERGNAHGAILIAALIFSAFHLQFEGFLPRVLLGILLGYLFYWSQNLWIPIFAHFIYNGLQVGVAYFAPELIAESLDESETSMSVEPWQLLITLGLTFFFGYYLRTLYQRTEIQEP